MADVKKLARMVLERVTGAKPAKLPPMFKREQAVVSQKLKDIAAQEKVARAKEARATAKWEKMSEAEKDKAMKERLFTPEQKERLPELEKRRAEEPKRELAPEDKAALRRELTMSPTDKLNQAAIDMKKERAARIAAAAEGGTADDDATKVLTTTQTMPMAKGAAGAVLGAGALLPIDKAEASPINVKKTAKAIVSKLPRTYYEETPKTLQEAAERYAKNEKPRSTPQFNIKAKDLWPYREFDRPLKPELAENIKKEGIKQPLSVEIGPDGKYYVAEGNHRLKAMMESGLQDAEVPVNVEFGSQDIGKKKLPGIKSEFQSSDKSALSKGLNALSIPQKILMRKTAEAMGIDLSPEGADAAVDSDKASEAIVEKTAEKLGIPESSMLGAVGKAAAKTVLDYGYDPLGPIGKIAKAAKGTKALSKVLSKLKK